MATKEVIDMRFCKEGHTDEVGLGDGEYCSTEWCCQKNQGITGGTVVERGTTMWW